MDDDPKSGKAKFKSKWNRVFKEKEEHEQQPQQPKHTPSFKLDDDVTAFLKPSTENAGTTDRRPSVPAPKLDIAIAQRWPDAHEVRKGTGTPNGGVTSALATASPNGYRKPRRRRGLRVGFARGGGEVIGEGGQECEEPASEIGRRRLMMRGRAHSDGRVLQAQGRGSGEGEGEEFVPRPLRRVQTSHSSVTVPVGEEGAGLVRMGTGLGHEEWVGEEQQASIPRIDTTFAGTTGSGVRGQDHSSASPRDAEALAVRKRELRSSEGLALRRVSALIAESADDDEDEDEEQKRQSMGFGVQLSDQHYETLSRPDAPDLLPEPRSASTPRSAKSPLGPSPFDDPRYAKRRSQVILDEAPLPSQPQAAAVAAASLRPKRETYQPSYMRAVLPQKQDLQTQQQAPMPAVPHVQPPRAEWDDRSSYGRTPQPASQTSLPMRPPAAPSENYAPTQAQQYHYRPPADPSEGMGSQQSQQYQTRAPPPPQSENNIIRPQPQYQSRSRDPSPMRDRIFGGAAGTQAPQPVYSQHNRSNGSLNHFPPSPKHSSHSRSSSRDGQSPYSDPQSGLSQPSPTRFQAHNQSPQNSSPRSSIIGRSPLSPHGSAPATAQPGYFGGQKPQQAQTLHPPAQGLQVDDPSSRPVSASSNRSFSRPLNSFSAPRPFPAGPPSVYNSQSEEAPTATVFPSARRQVSESMVPNQGPPQTWQAKTAGPNVRAEEGARPASSGRPASSSGPVSNTRPGISPQPTSEGNPATDAAYADFASRVAHMKGVFRLTAEKERPSDRCSPQAWLRAAIWWYTRGKAGLEVMLQQQRPRGNDGQLRELLTQPHVDLAKTWWILTDPLGGSDGAGDDSPQSAGSATGMSDVVLKQWVATLRSHIKSLSLSMGRNQLMPPPQSLIQGQDTAIWLDYPRFSTDAAASLSGVDLRAADSSQQGLQPLEALPIGDTRDVHCFGRFPVEATMGTDDAGSDRIPLQCVLTMLRGKREYLATVIIASQNGLVNLKIGPRLGTDRGLTWHDVSWKASSAGMIIRLPQGYDLMIRMSERDFRSLWNIVEYARKVDHSFRPDLNEKVVYEGRLAEMQYADSSNANAFPPEKIKGAVAVVFEKTVTNTQGGVERKMHRGYRLLLVTDPKNKSLANASHEVCQKGPLLFEFMTDSAAHGMAAMVVRVREETRQCRILLVFPDVVSRQNFYDVLNGVVVGPEEAIVSKLSLASMNIEPATQTEGFSQLPHPALQQLQWQKLGITNSNHDDHAPPTTVESDSLRVVARHATGCITDRLNLSKGELLLRLPCTDTPAIQILRNPQEDIIMSIDTRNSATQVTDGIIELLRLARTQISIRTLTFPSFPDLHAFQAAITGSTVRFDGLAASLSISRRRMVVPIYKKWEATTVRVQLVAHSGIVQVLAFMEGFSHADSLCFQVKSTDTFETVKGDGKGKKWAVKLVDAKFALPREREKGEGEGDVEERVRKRFVNLEGLEYMSEHDDVTVGFDAVEGESILWFCSC